MFFTRDSIMPDALGGAPPRQGLGTLAASPSSHDVQAFSGGATQAVAYALVNQGGGPFGQINIGTLTFSAGSGWAVASVIRTTSGHLGIQAVVDPSALTAGDYTATIPITVANANPAVLSLTLNVRVDQPGAVIVVSPQAGAIFDEIIGSGVGTSAAQSFKITNGGPGFLTGPTFSSITYESGTGWVTLTNPVTDGAGGFDFTVDVAPGNLTAGDYRASFVISDANAAVDVTFTVDLSLTAPPNPPTIAASPASFGFTATQGDNQASTQTLSISNSGGGSMAVPTLSVVGSVPWLTVGPLTATTGGYTVALTATTGSTAVGVHTTALSIASVGAANTPLSVPIQFDVLTPPVNAILTVSPSALVFSTVQGGANPSNKTATATNAGTGTLAGPTATKLGGASWLTVTRSGSANSYTFTFAVNNSGLLSASSPYTETVRITDANNTGTDRDVAVTVNVAASGATARPAPPHTLPVGMTFNTTTGLPEGTPLQIKYSDTPVTSWVNMETTPDSLGRVLGSNAVTNAAILQRWLNDDAATGTRRGYTCDTSRTFTGTITSPHNAGAGWSAIRPNGYTYDATLAVPRALGSSAPTLQATGANQPAFRTNTSGAADVNHGRFAIMGFHVTHDTTTGATLNSAISEGLIRLGASNENAVNEYPHGFLLHDCTVAGLAGRYLGRGMFADAADVEVRAVTFTRIHRSWTNATDTGQIQDAQCLLAIAPVGRYDCRYTIFHGGDECVNLGGGGMKIPQQVPGDFFFGWCEFSHDDAFLFNLSGTDGPANRTASDRWHAKNCFEQKVGVRVWHYASRLTGLTEPNNNQGYLATCKVGAYNGASTVQTSSDVCYQGCWFDRAPAMLGISGYESTEAAAAVNAQRVSMIDCFGWNLNKVLSTPTRDHQQTGKRVLFAHNIANQAYPARGPVTCDALIVRHVSCLTDSGSADGAIFAYNSTLPNLVLEDSIFPWCGHSILANDGVTTTSLGTNALNNMSGSTWTGSRNTICPRSGYPSGYPTGLNWTAVADMATLGVTDYAAGNLRLTGSYAAGGANGAADGWNRGVSDPAFWYTQLATTPTILASHPTVP